ncbi:MAG: hypothetical protein R6W68_01545 [Ignavibacteriaceae bacterium]
MCQLELFEKLLTIKVSTSEAHQVYHLELCDAVIFIRDKYQNLGLWLFVDGIQRNPNNIDGGILSSAKDIILLHSIVGG